MAGTVRLRTSRCVLARENRGSFLAVYVAKVRITVQADGVTIVREGHGSGEGRGTSPGGRSRHCSQDCRNRIAQPNGRSPPSANRLALSFTARTRADRCKLCQRTSRRAQVHPRSPVSGFAPRRYSTPIPRPSHYYGRRQQNSMTELLRRDQATPKEEHAAAASRLAPAAPILPSAKIDKTQLTIAEPKRLRDKAHLKFVASQPCLVCGRQPSDPHHLRFAQPRAIGLKVSDEFTVPLCRGHHRQLHQTGDEKAWWENLQINALEIARGLWQQSHPAAAAYETASGTKPM